MSGLYGWRKYISKFMKIYKYIVVSLADVVTSNSVLDDTLWIKGNISKDQLLVLKKTDDKQKKKEVDLEMKPVYEDILKVVDGGPAIVVFTRDNIHYGKKLIVDGNSYSCSS